MIGTLDVTVQAAHPAIPLPPLQSYVGSPSSVRVRNVPKRIGDWCIREVAITVIYPDGAIVSAPCVCVGGVWVGTVAGTQTSGTSENGYTIFASGTDENNQPVENYILGKGNVEIIEADGTLSPDPARYYVKLLSAEAEQPREGDMYPTGSGYAIWQNGQANQLGTPFEEITAYVDSAISSKADLSAIPTKTSQLTNDSGFITLAQVPTPSFIEDTNENKINADRTVEIAQQSDSHWTITDGTNTYTLTGSKTNASWNDDSSKYSILLTDGLWVLSYHIKIGSLWVVSWQERVEGSEADTNLIFSSHGFNATWEVPITQDVLALKSELEASLELKQDKLSEDQTYVLDREVYGLYTQILTPTGSFRFLSPATFDKSVLI